MAHILVADDEVKMRHLLSIMLERDGHSVEQAGDGFEAFEKINAAAFDMVITDIKMPRMDGLELLQKIRGLNVPCPVVFITAFASVDSAVDAMRNGAADYITKPFEVDRILITVERTLKLSRLMVENRNLRAELKSIAKADEIIYISNEMRDIVNLASRVAKTESAVMITGESGTGKELVARFIHKKSPRCDGRFVPVNCAAISHNLVESELFGYEKGAFTGADSQTRGKFEFASGGTLFLDEIGELPLEAQAKLLRTLQEKKILRVGSNKEISVDVRIICATNRNLGDLVQDGGFREDLYFRTNVFPIETPPLRERIEDIVPLANHLLARINGEKKLRLTDGAIRALKLYRWPGNVRELSNVMERALILMDEGTITADTLSFLRRSSVFRGNENGFRLPSAGISLDDLEKNLVRQALKAAGNNQSEAAKLLGLTRARFRVLMKKLV